MAKPTVKTGQTVSDSGIYQGNRTGKRVTLVKGEPAPPTKSGAETWKQVVDTNPKKK